MVRRIGTEENSGNRLQGVMTFAAASGALSVAMIVAMLYLYTDLLGVGSDGLNDQTRRYGTVAAVAVFLIVDAILIFKFLLPALRKDS